jgi:hypothetical protein
MFNAVCDPASLAFVSLEALTLESVVKQFFDGQIKQDRFCSICWLDR